MYSIKSNSSWLVFRNIWYIHVSSAGVVYVIFFFKMQTSALQTRLREYNYLLIPPDEEMWRKAHLFIKSYSCKAAMAYIHIAYKRYSNCTFIVSRLRGIRAWFFKLPKTDGGTMCYDRDKTRNQKALTLICFIKQLTNVFCPWSSGHWPIWIVCHCVLCSNKIFISIPYGVWMVSKLTIISTLKF